MAITLNVLSAASNWFGDSAADALRAGRKSWVFRGAVSLPVGVGAGGADMIINYIEVPVSCRAIAIGPGSELGAVMVLWRPPNSNHELQFFVDARTPLVLDMPVSPAQTYNSQRLTDLTGVPANGTLKIFPYWDVSSITEDQLDTPIGTETFSLQAPTLEVICYFDLAGMTSLPRGRPELVGRNQGNVVSGAERKVWETYAFRRRGIAWEVFNADPAETFSAWRFVGVTFINRYGTSNDIVEQEHQISPAVGGADNTIAASGTASYVLQGPRYHAYRFYATVTGALTPYRAQWTLFD